MSNQATHLNFWDISWGSDDAKHDDRLLSYFVPIPAMMGILEGQKRYLIARKGNGKTAICEYIRQSSELTNDTFCDALSIRDFPTHLFKHLADGSEISRYVPIWQFVIVTSLLGMMLRDQSIGQSDHLENITNFLQENFPHGFSPAEVLKVLRENSTKLSIGPAWIKGDRSRSDKHEAMLHVDYHEITNLLLSDLKSISSENFFYLVIDELDEGFQPESIFHKTLILSLIRAIEHTVAQLRGTGLKFRPLVAIRADIFDSLQDGDLNKLDDYSIHLRWFPHNFKVAGPSLRSIINSRIAAHLNTSENADYWDRIAYDNDPAMPAKVKSLWMYICNKTLNRPRDVLKFLKYCHDIEGNGRLTSETVNKADFFYSEWLFREIGDELHPHLPIWKDVMAALSRVGFGMTSFDEVKSRLIEDQSISEWTNTSRRDALYICQLLFAFSIIGNYDHQIRRSVFAYQDDLFRFDAKKKIIIHFGLHKKLRLRSDLEHMSK
jgi:hypothetical protein